MIMNPDYWHKNVPLSSGEVLKNFGQGSVLVTVLRVLEESPGGPGNQQRGWCYHVRAHTTVPGW